MVLIKRVVLAEVDMWRKYRDRGIQEPTVIETDIPVSEWKAGADTVDTEKDIEEKPHQDQAGMAWSEIAERAYKAYWAINPWKNYQGSPMPEFKDLPGKIQTAWEAAVRQAHSDISYGPVKDPEEWEGWTRP